MDDITFRTALKIRLGVEFGDRPIVCKCKNGPLLMNTRITCSIVTYLQLKSKIVMMQLFKRCIPSLNMLPNPFHFRNMVICELPLELMGELLSGD